MPEDIFTEIGSFLDEVFLKKSQKNFWEALKNAESGVSLRGYNYQGTSQTNPPEQTNPRQTSAADFIFQAKNRSTGFNILDITPPRLGVGSATFATLNVGGNWKAKTAGIAGNAISLAYTAGAVAGAEVVTVTGTAISVQIQNGVSTTTQVATAIAASAAAATLIGQNFPFSVFAATTFTATLFSGGTLVSDSSFANTIPQNVLFEKVGYRADNDTFTVAPPANLNGFSLGYNATHWKTIPVPIVGNFLKIEYISSPSNFPFGGGSLNTYTKPSFFENISGNYGPAGRRQKILIQFDDASAPPIEVNDGDCFELPFNGFFITCDQSSPRFSLIIGFNSKITSNPPLTTDLEIYPGSTLFSKRDMHPTPFCISRIVNGSVGLAGGATDAASIGNGRLSDPNYNARVATNLNMHGYGIFWITTITLCFYGQVANQAVVGSFAVSITTGGTSTVRKTLIRIPFAVPAGGASVTSQVAISKELSKPIRAVIDYSLDEFITGIINTTGGAIFFNWMVAGYVYGAAFTPPNGTNTGVIAEGMLDNPYPLDMYTISQS